MERNCAPENLEIPGLVLTHHPGMTQKQLAEETPCPPPRKHLVNSLGAYARSGGHCAFYWLSWESCNELEGIGKEAGLRFGSFIPDAVRDPVRPTFLD